jgi:hypothetical protein
MGKIYQGATEYTETAGADLSFVIGNLKFVISEMADDK